MSTSKPITVVHSDITITYNEGENKWTFTLRGRDRSADSLAKAKEFIDKPLPPEKAKPFEKIPAWFFRYSSAPKKIEVTGIAEGRGYGGDDKVWISEKGVRSKESVRLAIYPQNPKNDQIVQTIVEKMKQREKLSEEISNLQRTLAPLVLPKED